MEKSVENPNKALSACHSAIALIIIIATDLEDRTLKREMPGYKEYARQKARYRLLPGFW